MRFWILIILVIATVAAITESADLFEKVTFNPAGNGKDIKIVSDEDNLEREIILIENDAEPIWGKVNFGSLDAKSKRTIDANGTEGKQIGDSVGLTDMSANAEADSKVTPLPNGLTVVSLPGVRPDNFVSPTFAFHPKGSDNVLAPRDYYLSSESIKAKATNIGRVDKAKVDTNVAVFQVPFNEESFISEGTGTSTNIGETQKAAEQIKKTLNKLSKLAKDGANKAALSEVLFKGKGLTTEFNNVNNLINTGTYADAYSQGLTIALGKNDSGVRDLPSVFIKTDKGSQDIYGQFDHIYDFMKNRKGEKYYAKPLVDWAEKNADKIIYTLVVNQQLQSQFQGTSNGYATPISMNKYQENTLPFGKLLKSQGRQTKEPFYLYASIHPDAKNAKGGTKKKLPVIDSKHVIPDLAHIYGLFTGIHTQVWVGAKGINTSGSISQDWQNALKSMSKKMGQNKVKGDKKKLPHNANSISISMSEYNNNNLISGLSTTKGSGTAGDKSVYPNQDLIAALRVSLPRGEAGAGPDGTHVTIDGKKLAYTPISSSKYTQKVGTSAMYKKFGTGGDTFTKWSRAIDATKNIPIHPAIFNSNWGEPAAYIMLPNMLGGTAFPGALMVMMDEIMTPKGGGKDFNTMSYANRYVMAFNFKTNDKAKTQNSTGVVRVKTSSKMGTASNKAKPVVFAGYAGGETFSIVDYFKAQDAMRAGKDKPPLQAKTTTGEMFQLDYFNIFERFFTIRHESQLVGEGNLDKLKYTENFNKEGYKNKWEENKNKSSVKAVSPDYSSFFEAVDEEIKGDKNE